MIDIIPTANDVLQIPIMFDEFDRQPIEQLGMCGSLALQPKIVGRAN